MKTAARAGIVFGLIMGLIFGVSGGLASGIVGFVVSGGLFGLLIGLFLNFQAKKFSNMEKEVSNGKEVIKSGAANYLSGAEGVGGWLYLTTDSLIFVPHSFNIQRQGLTLSLNDVSSLGTRKTWGMIRNGLSVILTQGDELKFVVNRPADWVRTISGAQQDMNRYSTGYYKCAYCDAINEEHYNVTDQNEPSEPCRNCGATEWRFAPGRCQNG